MKNRKKLADDQLDAVSGGSFTDVSNTTIINLLERKLCPSCKNTMADTTVIDSILTKNSIPALTCSRCNVTYTKNSGHWQVYVDDGPSRFGMSC